MRYHRSSSMPRAYCCVEPSRRRSRPHHITLLVPMDSTGQMNGGPVLDHCETTFNLVVRGFDPRPAHRGFQRVVPPLWVALPAFRCLRKPDHPALSSLAPVRRTETPAKYISISASSTEASRRR